MCRSPPDGRANWAPSAAYTKPHGLGCSTVVGCGCPEVKIAVIREERRDVETSGRSRSPPVALMQQPAESHRVGGSFATKLMQKCRLAMDLIMHRLRRFGCFVLGLYLM